jgi:hypothetical protein
MIFAYCPAYVLAFSAKENLSSAEYLSLDHLKGHVSPMALHDGQINPGQGELFQQFHLI